MDMHKTHKQDVEKQGHYDDFVAHKLLDVILQHTTYTLYNAMTFMSDKAQDKLVSDIVEQKAKIQSARIGFQDDSEP